MTVSLLKNFNSMASLMPFLRASLRQTMIRKLASVGKDKDGWKEADEHLTTLMDQEHMITLEDTEAAVKRCEQHLQSAATDDASPKAKVLATEISGQDTAAELAALKSTTKDQDAKIKAMSAQLRGDTSGAKRARNGCLQQTGAQCCGLLGQTGRGPSQARLGQGGSRQEEVGHVQASAV
jgi:hypothetical protein